MPPQKQCRCRAIWTPGLPQFCHPAGRRAFTKVKQVLRSNLQRQIGSGPGISRPQCRQQIDAGRPWTNTWNGHQPFLYLVIAEPIRVQQAALAKGQGGGMEGARLGTGKSKRPKLLLTCRKNEIGREATEPGRESRPSPHRP